MTQFLSMQLTSPGSLCVGQTVWVTFKEDFFLPMVIVRVCGDGTFVGMSEWGEA